VRALNRFDRWLFAPGPARTLHGTATVLTAVATLRIALGPYRQLASQPDALFRPPWFLGFLDSMPPVAVIAVVQITGTVAGGFAMFRRRRPLTFGLAWLALLVLAGLRASRGKIQHNDVLLLLAMVPFLAAPHGTSWRDDRTGARFGWPVHAAMFVVAVGYCWSGVAKLLSSGPRWIFSDNMRNVLYDGARGAKTHAPELARWVADHAVLAVFIALVTIVFEVGVPLALPYARLRPAVVAGAVVLHGSIFVLLGLDYSGWVGAVVAVFVDWDALYSTVMARSGQLSAPMRA
jgi:hypothetical protein